MNVVLMGGHNLVFSPKKKTNTSVIFALCVVLLDNYQMPSVSYHQITYITRNNDYYFW